MVDCTANRVRYQLRTIASRLGTLLYKEQRNGDVRIEVAIGEASHIHEASRGRHCMHEYSCPDFCRELIKQARVVKLLFC